MKAVIERMKVLGELMDRTGKIIVVDIQKRVRNQERLLQNMKCQGWGCSSVLVTCSAAPIDAIY